MSTIDKDLKDIADMNSTIILECIKITPEHMRFK